MTRGLNKRTTATLCICAAAAIVMVMLHQRLDRIVQENPRDGSQVSLPDTQTVELLSLGYDRFIADLLWLGFIQYCGENRPRGAGYARAYDYVNLITELDPHFKEAYWFGCWAVGFWQQRPDLAEKIIQRGIQNYPEDWYMPFIAGINQYLYAKDYRAAAKYYRQAAKLPHAPDYLERQAMILESPIPEIAKRVQTLNQLYHNAKDPNLKESAYTQLVALLYDIYKKAPTEQIRTSARQRLEALDVNVAELEAAQ